MRPRGPARLVPYPCCPRCGKPFLEYAPRSGDGFPQCQGAKYGTRCGARWWFLMLAPGPVLPQFTDVFGPELAPQLMADHGLPPTLAEPMAWQVEVTPHEAKVHRTSSLRTLAHALGLTRRTA